MEAIKNVLSKVAWNNYLRFRQQRCTTQASQWLRIYMETIYGS